MSKPVIAYLGPQGTFSDEAVRAFADLGFVSSGYDELPCAGIPEVFEATDTGRASFGVVPIENSLEGPVTTVLDAFAFTSRSQILAELVLDVHQSLIVGDGASLADVEVVASHPQGIGQCRRFIDRRLPGRQIRMADSTAAAVGMAAADKTVAAIGSALAAELVGATVLEEGIEDNASNQTRFVLVGPPAAAATVSHDGPGKATLALFIQCDRSGILNMILSEFAYADVNLTMIQSRPTKRDLGDYMFFVDIDGYADEPHVATALNCLRMKLREVKVIGSYPRAR